jgi:pilus assembly protein CpaF
VATQRNLLVTGDVAAVAAVMGALGSAIPAERRVVSVGGAPARARPGWTELTPTLDMPGLARVAATLRAEHLLCAEAAGPEAADLLLAAARGQEGLAIALPARTSAEALARLEALASAALGAGGAGAGALVTSTIDLVVHGVTAADGTVRVVDVAEPRLDGRELRADVVAWWRSDGGRRGGGTGKLEVEGVSARLGAGFAAAGRELPGSLVRK